ncbi:4-galactosyl-N-acetylglucosaminide 3-alpha-L-fucosyltransferase 9-like [Lineus longissimus]|uniref:4-galactosyl-N-acetylglucosaminide 3-alpha-L-fucosyltransferase 9-like n=1 Tax=Lineus longissimus TaxID=88925 RepID=UPI00315CFF32
MRRLHVMKWCLLAVAVLVLFLSALLYTGQVGEGKISQPLSEYFENRVGLQFVQSVRSVHSSADGGVVMNSTERPHQAKGKERLHMDPKKFTAVVTTSALVDKGKRRKSSHLDLNENSNERFITVIPTSLTPATRSPLERNQTVLKNANEHKPNKTPIVKHRPTVDVHAKINVLFWTNYYGDVFKWQETFAGCAISKCGITTDKSLYNTSDAVIFHMWKGDFELAHLPKHRLENQHWLVFSREPPTRIAEFVTEGIRWTFNLTIGYSMASDVPVPYGRTVGHRNVSKVPKHDFSQGRTRLVAWVVSHCWDSSGRFEFVEELNKSVTVDVFGRCGKPCPGDDGKRSPECLHAIGKQYKFYLALENSDCIDYVTEKVWKNAYRHNLVPIVRGSMVKFGRVLPPHSYINADNFKSVEELGMYLTYVNTNNHVYNGYFSWKAVYSVYSGSPFCTMCEALHKMRGKKKTVDLRKWIDVGSQCNIAPSKGIQLRKSRGKLKTAI